MTDSVINLLKPPGMTSHDAVSFVRRIYRQKRVGHSGTLDPAAAGVLPIYLGNATRLVEYGEHFDKATRIYCFNPARAFPPAEELQSVAQQLGVHYLANSGATEQLADHLRQCLKGAAPETVHISFCGPKGLLQRVRELMRDCGVPEQNLHVELFEFR